MAIEICKYKRHTIFYEDGLFFAKKGKKVVTEKCPTEQDVKDEIDRNTGKIKAEKQKKASERKKEQQLKKLTSSKFIVSTNEFYNMIKRASEYVGEARIIFGKGKIEIVDMDPANVCLFRNVVNCKGSAPDVVRAVNTNIVKSLLKNSKSEVKISFELDKKDIKLVMQDHRGRFTVPTIEYEGRDIVIPTLKPTSTFKIPKTSFMEYIRGGYKIAESILFETKNGYLTLSAENDGTEARYEKRIKCATGKNVKSKYALEYLSKLALEGRMLTIKFGKDYPIQISDSKGNLFILAPRV